MRPEKIINCENGKQYREVGGICFNMETAPEIREWILTAYERKTRMRFHWGDTKTGLDWGDVYDVAGYVVRSMGPIRIPLLIHSRRSFGGCGIPDHCIVKIAYSNKKYGGTVYTHPNYHIKD